MLERVNTLITTSRSPLEEQDKQLAALEKEALSIRPKLEELERCSQAAHEALVFDNVHTHYTMESLHVSWEQLLTTIRRSSSEIENQILIRDSKGISTEQMNEFRKSFNHFDKNRTRTLEPKEFKACLVSLGYNMREDKQVPSGDRRRLSTVGDTEFLRVMAQVDPNDLGYVTFDAFLDFMTRETADTDSSEQFLDSFKTLADNKPYITPAILYRELPADQAEYCIQNMPRYEGPNAPADALDYTQFTAQLYGESDM
jgi:actinin alpha 1/4